MYEIYSPEFSPDYTPRHGFNPSHALGAHTHYTMGGPEAGEYGFVDWEAISRQIFTPPPAEVEYVARHAVSAEQQQANQALLATYETEYTGYIGPDNHYTFTQLSEEDYLRIFDDIAARHGSDPVSRLDHNTSGKLVVTDETGTTLEPYVGSTETHTLHEVAPADVPATTVAPVDGVGALGLAVAAVGAKNSTRRVGGWLDWVRQKFDTMKQPRQEGRHTMSSARTEAERKERRRRGFLAAAAVGTIALIALGLTYCDDDETSAPPPAASSTPGPGYGGHEGEQDNADKTDKDKPPTVALLSSGSDVWTIAHDLLNTRSYNHGYPNTDAIKDAMLKQMHKTEAQARKLPVNTKVPLFDDEEIEDILDNFSNTNPHKIK